MRYFFLLAFCCLVFHANSQCPLGPAQWINAYYEYKALKVRTLFQLPRVAPLASCRDTGMVYYNPPDSSLHWWTGFTDRTFTGGGTIPDSLFLTGFGVPPSGLGINTQRYYDQQHGFLYRKVAGSWAFNGILLSDTTYMHDSTLFQGPILKLTQWSPLAQNWNTMAIQRNQNNPSNAGLPYLDDPVIINGWNVDINGAVVNPALPVHIWQHESNFKTNPFLDSAYYEDHISIGWPAGSSAFQYFAGENGAARIESILTNQRTPDVYKYNTKIREFWQWPSAPGALSTTYFDMTPQYFGGRHTLKIDSIDRTNAIMQFDGFAFLNQLPSSGTTDRYIFQKSGFADTADLQHGSGDFYYKVEPGGTQIVRYGSTAFLAVGDLVGGINQGLYGSQQMSIHNTSIGNANFDISQGSGVFGITLNGTPTGKAYLDIASKDLGQYFNMYFRHNNTFVDSVPNGVNWNMEKFHFGSAGNPALVNTYGYQFNLNYLNRFATVFTGLLDAGSAFIPKWVFMSHQAGGSTMDTVIHIMPTGAMSLGNSEPAVSAKLDVQSTTQGVLLPRMTTTQKNAIASPAEGLQVYDLTLHQMSYWNGSTWINF